LRKMILWSGNFESTFFNQKVRFSIKKYVFQS
jgi:hypothetical protein